MSFAKRAKKKKSPKPPCLISLLPEEILVDIVARVPRCYYPTLSQVSRRFRSLVASPELYDRRSFFRNTELCLYVAISKDQTSDIHWFTLCRKPNGENLSDHRLVHISSLPPNPLHGSYVGVGSKIFVMGGFCDWEITPSVSLIDCRSHRAQPLADMPKAAALTVTGLIDRKIYVIGGSDTLSPLKSPSRSEMVFDIEAGTWEVQTKPDWGKGERWLSSAVMGGKIYMRNYCGSFVYDPKEGTCEKFEALHSNTLHSKEWSNSCVIEDVLFYYDVRGECLRAYDPKRRYWEVVEGLEGLLPKACKWSKAASYGGLSPTKARNWWWSNAASYGRLLPTMGRNRWWSKASSFSGGRLVLLLQKTERAEIWCAEISVRRRHRRGVEIIWGKVEWCDVVLVGNFHIMDCVSVML